MCIAVGPLVGVASSQYALLVAVVLVVDVVSKWPTVTFPLLLNGKPLSMHLLASRCLISACDIHITAAIVRCLSFAYDTGEDPCDL